MADGLRIVKAEPLPASETAAPPLAIVQRGPIEGYWGEEPGLGLTWHPPGVAPGQDPTSRRPDTAIATGVPFIGSLEPEYLLGGLAAVRNIGGAMIGSQLTAAQRVLAGLRATVTQAEPVVKYEVTKSLLQSMGVPAPVAIPIAIGVSGYQRGRGAAPAGPRPGTPTAPVPAPVSPPSAPLASGAPAASAPVVPAPPAARGTPAAAPTSPVALQWSPQRIQNELGLAARRAKVKLTEDQYQEAAKLVRAGQTPTQAVTAVAPPKVKVSAAEMGAYTNLRRLGKSHQEAVDVIQAQRELAARLGTAPPEAVRQAVAQRNVTGRWPE